MLSTRLVRLVFALSLSLAAIIGSARPIKDGDLIALECLGHLKGARWLVARPTAAAVALNPEPVPSLSRWRVRVFANGDLSLRSAATAKAYFLNGDTAHASVYLVPKTDGEFSGARWTIIPQAEENVIALECAGDLAGPRLLDGRTVERDVILSTDAALSGTRWRIHFLSEPASPVRLNRR
jgi:hypothetical protein